MAKNVSIQGRGAGFNPGNRFEKLFVDFSSEDPDFERPEGRPKTQFFYDSSRTILAGNQSPDVPFTFSVNPYRGCEHGCVYCYARPTHEYLGFSSGLDFETRILVKTDAAKRLEEAFQNPLFEPQVISLSGNTDPYQPAEKKLEVTRSCLEVFLRYRNPVAIITKNSLITRDIDILQSLTELNLVSVAISITSLDRFLISKMEPRTSTPDKRLLTIRRLADAGIPVGVNAAPIIPGLTDEELPEILRCSAASGARSAGYILVRLPYSVQEIFVDWVQRQFPLRAEKILNRIRETRGGLLNDPNFHSRMTGEGELSRIIADIFDACCKKYGLNQDEVKLSTSHFVRSGQLSLFN